MDRADTGQGQNCTETRDFLENVLEACGDGIFITDNTAAIIKVNRSFAEMLGKSRDGLIGAYIWELMPLEGSFGSTTGETVTLDQPSRQSHIKQFEKRFLCHGDDVTLDKWETYFLNGRGEVVPLEITATFQMDSQGSFLGSVCSARDITERRKAENQLHEAYQFQTRFFTNITHEFRTPLTLLIGPLESMLQGELGVLSDVVKEQLRLALRNSRQRHRAGPCPRAC